jgi:hypothetical protein
LIRQANAAIVKPEYSAVLPGKNTTPFWFGVSV